MIGRRKKVRCRGLAAVEAAIVFPLLILLTLGVIEYGWMFLKAQQITNAARHAARVAVFPDSSNGSVLDEILAVMTLAEMESSGYSVTFTPPDVALIMVGDPLEVKIKVPWANIGMMNIALLPGPANIGAATTMSKEGP